MLVVFVNVPSLESSVMTVYPPIGILSMSACLKREGHDVKFIDADVCRQSPELVVEKLSSYGNVGLLGITLNASQVASAIKYIETIKSKFPQLSIVLGGPYVTGVGTNIFDDFSDVDYAIVKEGEYAIVDLVGHLQGNCPIENVRNLLYQVDGSVTSNPVERIEDLDSLPLPDYSLVLDIIEKYTSAYPSVASPAAAIMCSRGCPYNCTFCSSKSNWDRRQTYRSTESVMKEIHYLQKTIGVKEIFFQDDTLNARPSWFIELCDRIIADKLNESILFRCPFRVNSNLLDKKILAKAKHANFWMIFYGIENGNQQMLNMMRKDIKIKEIRRAFKLTRKAGIATYASFMIGNYGETHETARESLDLMKEIVPDFGGFAVACPFPGTELYDIASKNDLMINGDFKKYQHGDCIMRTEGLTQQEIVDLVNNANLEFVNFKESFKHRFYRFMTFLYGVLSRIKTIGS